MGDRAELARGLEPARRKRHARDAGVWCRGIGCGDRPPHGTGGCNGRSPQPIYDARAPRTTQARGPWRVSHSRSPSRRACSERQGRLTGTVPETRSGVRGRPRADWAFAVSRASLQPGVSHSWLSEAPETLRAWSGVPFDLVSCYGAAQPRGPGPTRSRRESVVQNTTLAIALLIVLLVVIDRTMR